ncbi:RWD domain-containing protein 2B-like isoform X2 [Mizuhopecten yessoensis]|uniref:RWD domain-containing protein 2B-like isoform X2 n=1 Tax=Mizuhopecten yessoensis TaxID=6573 RepID=UPI000B45A7C5|nr:RWD domain-containing protein 2B-like isoform X2 [Mizuhopecten yessoensis]
MLIPLDLGNFNKKMDDLGYDEDNDVDVSDMLELQLSEVEMLTSMFPSKEEFKMDDPCTVAAIRSFLDGKMLYEYLHKRVGFSINVTSVSSDSKVGVELVCNFPHEYPHVAPVVFTRSPLMNRENHQRLNEDLSEFINSIERGEICIFSVIEWLQENVDQYLVTIEKKDAPSVKEVDTIFARLWIYSHHIYSKFKRRDIIDWAQELKLTGFSLPGKPGVICVEGYSRSVEEYWQRLRRQNWKRLVIKEKEDQDIGDNDIKKYYKFDNFEEKVFDARGGKGREYHMDLGKLFEFLEKRGCKHIFSLYFGVDGKMAAD